MDFHVGMHVRVIATHYPKNSMNKGISLSGHTGGICKYFGRVFEISHILPNEDDHVNGPKLSFTACDFFAYGSMVEPVLCIKDDPATDLDQDMDKYLDNLRSSILHKVAYSSSISLINYRHDIPTAAIELFAKSFTDFSVTPLYSSNGPEHKLLICSNAIGKMLAETFKDIPQ